MTNFILLAVCLFAGILLKKGKKLPETTPAVLNGFVIYISLPALVLGQLQKATLTREALFPLGAAWLIFFLSVIFFISLGKVLGWNRKVLGTLILMSGLGNTSFVGYPMLEALFGADSLKVGMIVDQLGSFPALSTVGIAVASFYSTRKVSARRMVQRIFSFPPSYALCAALLLNPFQLPDYINGIFDKLGATVTPLALVSVGFQLELKRKAFREYYRKLLLGLGFKLVLGPALLAALYLGIFHARGHAIQITLLQAAMAPMITAAVIVSEYELDSELASLMVGIGIPLSFISVPIWAFVTRKF